MFFTRDSECRVVYFQGCENLRKLRENLWQYAGVSGATKPITRPPRRVPDSNPVGTGRFDGEPKLCRTF